MRSYYWESGHNPRDSVTKPMDFVDVLFKIQQRFVLRLYIFFTGKIYNEYKIICTKKMVLLSSCKNILQQQIWNKRSSSPRSCPTRRSENGADLHRAHLNNFMPEMAHRKWFRVLHIAGIIKKKIWKTSGTTQLRYPQQRFQGQLYLPKNILAEIHFHSAVWEQKVPFAPSLPSP